MLTKVVYIFCKFIINKFITHIRHSNSYFIQNSEMHRLSSIMPTIHRELKTIALQRRAITMLKLNQQSLPKQPIPDLKITAERYLRSLKPLLSNQEFNKSEKIVQQFISSDGPGPYLQSKLLERFENTNNWMQQWWLNTAYLGYRAPVIVNSSPGTVGPLQKFKTSDDMILYAARVILAVNNFNEMVKSGKMKQEMVKNHPLDMQPYGMILGSHREPCKPIDKLLHTDDSNHCIIMNNNHLFKLCLVDERGSLDESKLLAALKDIMDRSCTKGKPIGILTGNDRDSWTDNYNKLLGSGNNKRIVKEIESSLFILCLDEEIPEEACRTKNNASIRAIQCMTGYSSHLNSGNRWHDKTVQFIVSAGGCVGIEYEHSPCEGVPIAVLHDYVLKSVSNKDDNAKVVPAKDFPQGELLQFEINEALENAIHESIQVVDAISKDIDMECFTFDKFGTDVIKQMKFSPDSFIQTALQVTVYKLKKNPVAHYESAGLRRYRDSRTECIRSTSMESIEFAKLMSQKKNVDERCQKESMIKAINVHKTLVAEAVIAQGVDRHLFGLKMIAQDEGMQLPELYKDVGYIKSTHFVLTSSQVPYKTESFMCYGPVVPEGYGCCYNPRPKDILFACSSFASCPDNSSKEFADVLQETLCHMQKLGSKELL